MSQHLISTEVQVARCPRCEAYVLACTTGGVDAVVDLLPLGDPQAYVGAIIDNRRTFDVIEMGGKPWKLEVRTPSSPVARFDGTSRPILGEHRCKVHGRDPRGRAEVVPVGPHPARVRPGRASDGRHPRPAPAEGSQSRTEPRARPATRHPSRHCDRCKRRIRDDEDMFAVEIPGRPTWAVHADPCNPHALHALSEGRDWLALLQLHKKGLADKPVETLQLPDEERRNGQA